MDISKVDPNSNDYLDMFAYSSHLTDSGECPGAQEDFAMAINGISTGGLIGLLFCESR